MKKSSIEKYAKMPPVSDAQPGPRFMDGYLNSKDLLKRIILPIKENNQNLHGLNLRIGMVNPVNVIIDEGIKELCAIPFRREDGSRSACEGITENWKGCPPHSPAVVETVKLLHQAAYFLVFQFEGITELVTQKHIHLWTLRVEQKLKESNFDVIFGFSCGPCRICSVCADDQCRATEQRRFALESCGVWVDHLCRKASEHPIDGDENWGITWVTDWNLPTQTPPSFKSVTGILIG